MAEDCARMSVDEVFERIVAESVNKKDQGTAWERAVKFFLENDPLYANKFDGVWMWADAPTNHGQQDVGIDLVAHDAETGEYWAIQAKCYTGKTLSEGDVSTFFMQATEDTYAYRVLADTATKISKNLDAYVEDHEGVVRIGLDDIRRSNLPWQDFWTSGMRLTCEEVHDARIRLVNEPRPHQRDAIDAAKAEFDVADRTTIVMACGTGKTLTALRLAEELVPGGTVLFLAPSISLVAQSMRDWAEQVRGRLNPYVVCSDPRAASLGKGDQAELAESYGTLSMVPYPATTNPGLLASRFRRDPNALNVVFSTYQSIDVIHAAQQAGLPRFDLVICDEAHRTTGKMRGETGDADESSFVKVHSNEWVDADRRLYMTATPRIYRSDNSQAKLTGNVKRDEGVVASMDNEAVYGRVCYRLTFGKAVELGLLTDYKIVVMEISEDMMPKSVQQLLMGPTTELKMPDAAKFVGVWKALWDRRHAKGTAELLGDTSGSQSADDATRTLHHAIAFAASIKASKELTSEFSSVVDSYLQGMDDEEGMESPSEHARAVSVEMRHVDGTMDAQTRRGSLDWLAEYEDEDVCHVLSNARCLAEGIDVPSLDAVIYLSSRKSKVDIIQSVGRVMRKAPGKEFGYIILPIFVASGGDAGLALSESPEFKIVYQVVSSLRSHDERLEAKIAAAGIGDLTALSKLIEVEVLGAERLERPKRGGRKSRIGESEKVPVDEPEPTAEDNWGQTQMVLGEEAIARGIYAQIVRKCGTRIYWGEWAGNVGAVTRARAKQVAELVSADGPARDAFLSFLQGLRDSLNPGYDEAGAVNVLAQHEVTRPIFEALFNQDAVLENNPIVIGLDRALSALYDAGLPDSIDDPDLSELYGAVRMSAAQVETDAAKQELIRRLYNDFFSKAFKDAADELGIVYTPVEVVDAQLHMVQRALQREFGESLGDRGVHVLDGFAGTGTYLSRLIEDPALIPDEDLPYKYDHDLHSNEIVPLAATIMDINIEQSYHARMGGAYRPFPGALLTDTFQLREEDNRLDHEVFRENTEHIRRQESADITVIVGNPPYRSGDKDNTGNQNAKYKTLDGRIAETYAANSTARLKTSLYDHYVRAFRWASDRIGDAGIVCFVSNGGWLKGEAGAGVRRCFCEEFNSIYVYNLRGNARGQGEERRKEKDNVFGEGTRTTVAITLLVKNPASEERGVIRYRDIGDYLSRQEKLDILKGAVDTDPEWTVLTPDRHGDWLDQRDDAWYEFVPSGIGKQKPPFGLFTIWSNGLKTQRDAWAWGFSRGETVEAMRRLVGNMNGAAEVGGDEAIVRDDTRFNWTRRTEDMVRRGKKIAFRSDATVLGLYRPFCRQWVYYDPTMNEMTFQQPRLFPLAAGERAKGPSSNPNVASLTGLTAAGGLKGKGGEMTFQQMFPHCQNLVIDAGERGALMCGIVPDLEVVHHGQCFPLYWYDDSAGEGLLRGADAPRHDAITDEALAVFHEAYGDPSITKEDVFFYVYGVLHSREYRTRFANNLKKELPRIPLAADFRAFERAGRRLGDLHVNYEGVERYAVEEDGDSANPGRTEKMTWGRVRDKETGKLVNDYTVLKVAENLTLRGIPELAQDYVVNGKSALGWLVDRYRVKVDKKSGIVNDPNLYAPDDPRYIVDLVESVITVSLETLDIRDSLPPLNELPHPANWPAVWDMAGK